MHGIVINGTTVLPFVAPMSVISNYPVFAMDTMSLDRLTHTQGAQRWEIKTNVMPTNSAADFFVHSVVNNYGVAFDIRMPQVHRGDNYIQNNSTISATGAAGNTSVNISGNTGLIPKGEFVKFNTHNKTYMVTSDINGNGAMSIFPKLKSDVSGVMQHGDNVLFRATYNNDTIQGMIYTDGILSDPGVVSFIEAFRG